jgi:hypothetical protein
MAFLFGPLLLKKCADILISLIRWSGSVGRLLEVVSHLPGHRGVMLRVNEQDSRADRIRRLHAAQEDILEK